MLVGIEIIGILTLGCLLEFQAGRTPARSGGWITCKAGWCEEHVRLDMMRNIRQYWQEMSSFGTALCLICLVLSWHVCLEGRVPPEYTESGGARKAPGASAKSFPATKTCLAERSKW